MPIPSYRCLAPRSVRRIPFPPYNAIQIDKILQKRVAVGFNEDAFEGPVIPKIAGIAAQEHGDIRKAINLLRATGEIASLSPRVLFQSNPDRSQGKKVLVERILQCYKNQEEEYA